MSRPTLDLDSSIDRVRGLVDRILEDRRFPREAVLDALLQIETYCQALACEARREGESGEDA
jgi:hypothetical protein